MEVVVLKRLLDWSLEEGGSEEVWWVRVFFIGVLFCGVGLIFYFHKVILKCVVLGMALFFFLKKSPREMMLFHVGQFIKGPRSKMKSFHLGLILFSLKHPNVKLRHFLLGRFKKLKRKIKQNRLDPF